MSSSFAKFRESARELQPAALRDLFSKIFSIFKFDIALLVLPPGFQKNTVEIHKWARSQPLLSPLIALVEKIGPGGDFTVIGGPCDPQVELPGPLSAPNMLPFLWEAVGHLHRTEEFLYPSPRNFAKEELIGKHPAFLAEVQKIPVAAGALSNVFLSGATGTGKRLFAKKIHSAGPAAAKPFVFLCCGTLSRSFEEDDILSVDFAPGESMLGRIGGGTLFLDEVGCLPHSAQIKLLHLLENHQCLSPKSGPGATGFRVIAGSSTDAEEALHSGRILKELYRCLNAVSFKLPSLQERGSDIPLLAHYFLEKFAPPGCARSYAIRKLRLYEWPGNIRELEYTIRRTVTFMEGHTIRPSDIRLPIKIQPASRAGLKKPKREYLAQPDFVEIGL